MRELFPHPVTLIPSVFIKPRFSVLHIVHV